MKSSGPNSASRDFSCGTTRPVSFTYVHVFTTRTTARPSRPFADQYSNPSFRNFSPISAATASATIHPMLCRVFAYFSSGFPMAKTVFISPAN
jgi:hypothetical protein